MASISDESDKVFRISLPGEDVNSSEPEEYVVHSGFDYPKMEEDLVGTVEYTCPVSTAANTYTVLEVAHTVGYKPNCQVFVEDIDNVTPTQFATLPFLDGYSGNRFAAYTTDTKFIIEYVVLAPGIFPPVFPGQNFKFKYQVWVND